VCALWREPSRPRLPTRQSNNLARFTASKEIVNQFNQLNHLVTTDSELRQLLARTGELSADEREQIYNFSMMFCGVWLSAQIAHDNHQLEGAVYAACAKDVEIELERWPNFRAGVEQWLANYPENAHHRIFRPAVREASRESGAAVQHAVAAHLGDR
jgi:hypothetical protein